MLNLLRFKETSAWNANRDGSYPKSSPGWIGERRVAQDLLAGLSQAGCVIGDRNDDANTLYAAAA
jgi:hypothetical protein